MSRRSDIIGVIDATGNIFKASQITVTDVATLIPSANLSNRKAVSILNYSNVNWIYIGGSDVTVGTGYPIQPYQGIPFDLGSGSQLYAICETGKTADVRILEVDNS
jgi:hypothetical protein